jgi:hypothetical protein
MATPLTQGFNLGVGIFPNNTSCREDQLPLRRLDMTAGVSVDSFKNAYRSIPHSAGYRYTPLAKALRRVKALNLLDLPSDPQAANREQALVLITDGAPNSNSGNSCSASDDDLQPSEDAITALKDAGIPVYVIGIDGTNESAMEALATKGGTDNNPSDPDRSWYLVSDPDDLVQALNQIASVTLACEFQLADTGVGTPDYGRTSVTTIVDGARTLVPRGGANGWTVVADGPPARIGLQGTACSSLRSAVLEGKSVSVEVKVACATPCPSDTEICDNLIDDNCNGQIDEGCEPRCICSETEDCDGQCPVSGCVARPEICDGVDNDCDEVVDEGCCVASDEVCGDGIDNDCDGEIDEGCDCGPEICDGVDNDCDGKIDEGCPAIY